VQLAPESTLPLCPLLPPQWSLLLWELEPAPGPLLLLQYRDQYQSQPTPLARWKQPGLGHWYKRLLLDPLSHCRYPFQILPSSRLIHRMFVQHQRPMP
jgi:hypothetical protein